jgi:tRNA(Ile)-lysidine synthase
MLLASAVLPGRFAVATVDHGLRAESAGEAGMVARLCRERGVAHRTITLALPGGAGCRRGRGRRAMPRWGTGCGPKGWARWSPRTMPTIRPKLSSCG